MSKPLSKTPPVHPPGVRLEYCFYRGPVTKDNFIAVASAEQFVAKYSDGRAGPVLNLRARHKDGRRSDRSYSPGAVASVAHFRQVMAAPVTQDWIAFIFAGEFTNTNHRVAHIAAREARIRKGSR